MDKTEAVFYSVVVGIVVALLTSAIILGVTICDYELWAEDDMSFCGSQVDELIEARVDSLIVIDSTKPTPIGALCFKSYEGE